MGTTPQTIVGGRYRLEREIGVGATARVWVAFDAVLERRVAIKMLATPIAGESAHVERFRREARAVAKLQHPHIVAVLDSGEHGGMPYIVLEFVDGETLKERIARVGRLTITEAVAFAIEIARALDAAHARGIVHRDVKPQNILLDPEAGAKITDFGIARSDQEAGLTLGGRVLGTTDYVSPEQALGHEVTGQSDLYSLGIVLYESLTGTVPFSAPSRVAVATMHVRNELPDLQRRRPEVSAALTAVVERATAKHLARRYTRARELIADLEEALAIETVRTGGAGREATIVLRSLPARASRRVPLRVKHPAAIGAALGVAAAIAAAVALLVLTRTHSGTPSPVNLPSSPGEVAVHPSQTAAVAYNPFGTSPEDPATVGQAIDGDTSTSWHTSNYDHGALGKSGVGFYINAAPGVAANRATIDTPTPGFHFQIWATDSVAAVRYHAVAQPAGTPASLGWTLLAQGDAATMTTTIPLHHVAGRVFYLLWITSLGPDPLGRPKSVQIAEFTLYSRGA